MTPGRIWLACLAALTAPLAWRLLQETSAFWWLVAVAAFLVTVGSLTAAKRRSAENIDLRLDNADKDGRIAELEALLGQAQTVPVPLLRIVPSQRDGEHDRLPVADGAFPVHTAIEDDELTALMRATEEK
jgi:hypothetical protein